MNPTTFHRDTFCKPNPKLILSESLWSSIEHLNLPSRLTGRVGGRFSPVNTRKVVKLFYTEYLNHYEMSNPRTFEIHAMHKMMSDLIGNIAHLGDLYYDLHKKEDNTLENIQEMLNLANQINDEYENRYFNSQSRY